MHASGPEGLTEIAAVGVLEPDVDDEQVGRALGLAAQRRLGAVARRDVESLLGEAAENQVPEFRVVLDDMDVRAPSRSQYRLPPCRPRASRRVLEVTQRLEWRTPECA